MTKKELLKYAGKLVVLYPKDKSKGNQCGCLVNIEDELKLLKDSTTIPLKIDPSTIERVEIAPKEEEQEIISIDKNMKKKFLQAINRHGDIRTMNFFLGYPPKWVSVKTEELCEAIFKDVEELEEKKNATEMPREAYEKRLNEANETVSKLLNNKRIYENEIDRLQEVIVSQALKIVELKKETAEWVGKDEKTKI